MKRKLIAKNLTKIFKSRTVVESVSLELSCNEIVGLLGPNGAGKTTTFNMIVGFLKPDKGKIYINNTDITNYPIYKRARMGVGYLPQEKSVFQKLTVWENLMAIAEMLPMTKEERKKKVLQIIEKLKLSHLINNKAYTLSGGERRKVEIGRALVLSPSFLLLDEPFSGVDPIAVSDLQKIIKNLKDMNIGILITDHNAREILEVIDRGYLLYDGKIMITGSSAELVKNRKAIEKYFGENFYIKEEVYK